ncbi:hypothetical protein BC937DRAFT_86232 [Endogone sp. FLAS-F59071]|nr:hypothetical protein BC937DRAFT_86232 [Endogone sp. FLAS-F59071]|eukprot:RUS13169.1 hypothetical protein BC937DRAFT_86232 [Endogone sp. FLAS-F59071]
MLALRRAYTTESWSSVFQACSTPQQLSIVLHRLFYKHPDPHHQTIMLALNACERMAMQAAARSASGRSSRADHKGGLSLGATFERKSNNLDTFIQSIRIDKVDTAPTPTTPSQLQPQSASQFQPALVYYTPADIAHLVRTSILSRLSRHHLNTAVYASYLSVLSHTGDLAFSFSVLADARRSGIVPSTDMYCAVLATCAKTGNFERAKEIVKQAVKQTEVLNRTALWLKVGMRIVIGVEAGKYIAMGLEASMPGAGAVAVAVGVAVGVVVGGRMAAEIIVREAGILMSGRDGNERKNYERESMLSNLTEVAIRGPEEVRREMWGSFLRALEREGRWEVAAKVIAEMEGRRAVGEVGGRVT